jgi:hypothetical protein
MKATVTDIATWRAQYEPTAEDYQIVEQSRRRLAARARRKGEIAEAEHWDSKADEIARARTPRCPNESR